MKLSSYTAKKGLAQRLTIKGKTGSYKSDESTAEVTMTFEGEDIDTIKANETANKAVKDLLDSDPNWLKEPYGAGAATKYEEAK
jgi:hypothetical protein